MLSSCSLLPFVRRIRTPIPSAAFHCVRGAPASSCYCRCFLSQSQTVFTNLNCAQVAELPKAVLVTSPEQAARPVRSYSKTLDYKSCQHILCLTKDMARHLLPPAPHSATHAGTCLIGSKQPTLLFCLLIQAPTALPHAAITAVPDRWEAYLLR